MKIYFGTIYVGKTLFGKSQNAKIYILNLHVMICIFINRYRWEIITLQARNKTVVAIGYSFDVFVTV